MEKKNTNKKFITIFLTLIIVGGSYGTYKYLHAQSHELTDDAQIEKKMNPIIPRVSGYVDKVYVKDNDYVKKGDTLYSIARKFKTTVTLIKEVNGLKNNSLSIGQRLLVK